jgi:hypothetical protein
VPNRRNYCSYCSVAFTLSNCFWALCGLDIRQMLSVALWRRHSGSCSFFFRRHSAPSLGLLWRYTRQLLSVFFDVDTLIVHERFVALTLSKCSRELYDVDSVQLLSGAFVSSTFKQLLSGVFWR